MTKIRSTLLGALGAAFVSTASWAAELVMVEQVGCHWCERWNTDIAPAYPKTTEGQRAPLRRVDIRDLPEDVTFASRPVFTPTFVLVEDGKELGRMEGYNGDEFFWFLLGKLISENLDTQTK